MILLHWKLRLHSDQSVFNTIYFDPTGKEKIIVFPEVTDPDFKENFFLQHMKINNARNLSDFRFSKAPLGNVLTNSSGHWKNIIG